MFSIPFSYVQHATAIYRFAPIAWMKRSPYKFNCVCLLLLYNVPRMCYIGRNKHWPTHNLFLVYFYTPIIIVKCYYCYYYVYIHIFFILLLSFFYYYLVVMRCRALLLCITGGSVKRMFKESKCCIHTFDIINKYTHLNNVIISWNLFCFFSNIHSLPWIFYFRFWVKRIWRIWKNYKNRDFSFFFISI